MNDLPRQTLCDLIATYGRSLCDDPRRCEGLLRDLCGEHRREIFVLVSALRERVAAELLASQDSAPRAVLLARLTRRLQDNLALTVDAARWAVETWARALGTLSPAELGVWQPEPHVQQVESLPSGAPSAAPPTGTPDLASGGIPSVDHHQPKPLEKTLVNSIGIAFVLIPPGEFLMGANDGLDDEKPVHKVRISQPFYLGQYEVTQGQWEAVMGNNPSFFTGDPNQPVEKVSWDDVQTFIRRLNARESGATYRLPTEAEWEYVARGSSTTAYSFGDDRGQLREYAWYEGNSGGRTHPVGQLKPNAWGLYDMHGNLWEWVQDWYGSYASSAVTDPKGPDSASHRVYRGGSWSNDARFCRSSVRHHHRSNNHNLNLGFRLLRTAP